LLVAVFERQETAGIVRASLNAAYNPVQRDFLMNHTLINAEIQLVMRVLEATQVR
jgi:hypothetical protein